MHDSLGRGSLGFGALHPGLTSDEGNAGMIQVSVEHTERDKNQRIGMRLRSGFEAAGTLCLNLIGAPGAGKTALLERTLERLSPLGKRAAGWSPGGTGFASIAILLGGVQTENDAMHLARYGYPVRQIVTGSCHLNAQMVANNLWGWDLPKLDLLFIENVGNLVCTAVDDLGEDAKLVLVSAAEAEDEPLRYPGVFRQAELMILNKVDLLPYVAFRPEWAREYARRIHPDIKIIETSAKTGAGLDDWLTWLALRADKKQAAVALRADVFH